MSVSCRGAWPGPLSRAVAGLVVASTLSVTTSSLEAQRRRPRRPASEPATQPAPEPRRGQDERRAPEDAGSRQLSDADRAQARALFQAGAAAVDAGRWADAVESFRSAYELTGAPSALFNTGFALRALGRYREARDAFVALEALSNVAESMRTQTQELLSEVRMRIARVRLGGLEDDTRYGVRLDGVGVEDEGQRPLFIEADPGAHAVDVMLSGHETFTWSGTLADGALLDVPVSLVPLPSGGGGGGGVLEEAWFWLLIGGVVVVGAGLATYVVLDDQAQLRPESTTVFKF